MKSTDSLLAAGILGSETPLVHSSLVVSKISSQERDLGVDSLKQKQKKITCMKKKTTFCRYAEHEEPRRLNYKEQLGWEDSSQKTKF
jgi:hypothetical protein